MKITSILLITAAAVANAEFITIYTHPANITTTIQPTHKSNEPHLPNPTEPGHTQEPHPTNPQDCITKTATYVYPHPTIAGDKVTKTITYTVPLEEAHNSTVVYQPSHTTYHASPSGGPHVYPNGTCVDCHSGNGGKGLDGEKDNGGNKGDKSGSDPDTVSKTQDASGPTTAPTVITTGAAPVNSISGGLLAIIGVAAFCLF